MNAYDKHFNKYPIYLIIKTIYWHIAYIQTYMLYLQRYKYSDVKCFPTTGGSQISSWWLYIGSICMLNPGKALCSGPGSVTLLSVRCLKKTTTTNSWRRHMFYPGQAKRGFRNNDIVAHMAPNRRCLSMKNLNEMSSLTLYVLTADFMGKTEIMTLHDWLIQNVL